MWKPADDRRPASSLELIGGLGAIALAVLVILLLADYLHRFLGTIGMEIATRLLGLVLAAIGVQFMLNGLANATVGLINPQIIQ